MAEPHFDKAAARHFRDAVFLRDNGYLANADHLSGFSAECAIKAIIVNHLGGHVYKGFPYAGDSTKVDKHIGTWLWKSVASYATGQLEPEVVALFEGDGPFKDWAVGDRYADGSHLTAARVDAHIAGATAVLTALEAANLSMNNGDANEV